jgi:hypothetical protein
MIIVVDCTNGLDGSEDLLSLPKIPSGLDSGLRKNHRMIQDDACDLREAGTRPDQARRKKIKLPKILSDTFWV